jgi:hypothetical protein
MTTYIVSRKLDGAEVYRYNADAPIEWSGMSFADFDHSPVVEEVTDVVPRMESKRRLTKLAYMNRFTDIELATIYSVAKTEIAVEVWLAKFNAATPEADGTAIDLDDPRTIGGLQALEAAGLIGAGRAMEILNGQ